VGLVNEGVTNMRQAASCAHVRRGLKFPAMAEDQTFGVDALLRIQDVARLTGRSKWSVYADVRAGVFPKSITLSAHVRVWPASEVAAINRAVVAGANVAALQALVRELVAKRKAPPGAMPGGAVKGAAR